MYYKKYKKYRKYTQTAQLCMFYEDIYTSPTPKMSNKCHEMTNILLRYAQFPSSKILK